MNKEGRHCGFRYALQPYLCSFLSLVQLFYFGVYVCPSVTHPLSDLPASLGIKGKMAGTAASIASPSLILAMQHAAHILTHYYSDLDNVKGGGSPSTRIIALFLSRSHG